MSLIQAAPAAAQCDNAYAYPNEISLVDYTAAVLCEVNEQRQAWGRAELVPQRNLASAAGWHAADMTAKEYFAHSEPDGDTLADRLDRANFIPSNSDRWRAGENLAAGHGATGTPAAIVGGWMSSKDHRLNLLDPGYTMVGIGVARGWPQPGYDKGDAITVDMDLGWRAATRRG